MFDIKRFLQEQGLDHTEGGKWSHRGWVQVPCPLCTGHSGYHGGFNLQHGYYHCYRCGWSPLDKILMAITKANKSTVQGWLKAYDIPASGAHTAHTAKSWPRAGQGKLTLPAGLQPCGLKHLGYLQSRGFRPLEIEREWHLQGTGHVGGYKFRIFAPIYLDGVMVSYQCRDITGKQSPPYKSCPTDYEIYHHKHTLYGIDKVVDKMAIIVEGIMDVWKLGPGAVATFGTGFTPEQVRLSSQRLDNIFIMFDQEEEAGRQGEKLANQLEGLGKQVTILDNYGAPDPALLEDIEAEYIMKWLKR